MAKSRYTLQGPRLDKSNEKEDHGLFTKIGGVFFRVFKNFDKKASNLVTDNSYLEISNNENPQSKIRMSSGGDVYIQSGGNLTVNSLGNANYSTKGNEKKCVTGTYTFYAKRDEKRVVGKQANDEKKAAEELQKVTNDIQEKRLAALNTKGNMVQCPVCSVTHLIDNKSSLVDGFMDFIRKLNIPYFCFPLDILHKLLRTLVSPILSVKKNIGLTGTQGCGSPGCKGGQVESPVNAFKAADTATANAIKANASKIQENSKKLGTGGAAIIPHKGDVIYRSGLKKNNAPSYKKKGHHTFGLFFKPGANGQGHTLAMHSKGSCERVIYCPPQRTHGSIMFDVSNNFSINAGSPGVDIDTSGRFNVRSGDVVVNATEGEAVFGSANVTTIKGKNIILDANDSSGDSGLSVQSPHTMFNGSLNVRGDAAFKGHLTTDGAISCPYLIIPSMRSVSTTSSSSKMKVEHANWQASGLAMTVKNLVKDIIFRYVMSGYMFTIAGLYALVIEVYDTVMMAITIELNITGICFGYAACAYGGGPFFGYVMNFVHNHGKCGDDHSHDVNVPKSSTWNSRKGWGQERMAGNPVPTPAPVNGDETSPGPRSKPGGCGGGGLYTKNRNESYGLNILDPYMGLNRIPVPIKRTPDGTIIPTPTFSFLTTSYNVQKTPSQNIVSIPFTSSISAFNTFSNAATSVFSNQNGGTNFIPGGNRTVIPNFVFPNTKPNDSGREEC
jgi:hypothetical protein